MLAEEFDERDFSLGTELGAERRGKKRGGGKAEASGASEDGGVGKIAGDKDDLCVEFPRQDRFLERDKVAALAGTENGEAGCGDPGDSVTGLVAKTR